MSEATALTIAPASGDDLVPLVTWVKASEAPFIQAQIASLVSAGTASSGGAYKPPHSSTFGGPNAWDLPKWGPADAPAAAWILNVLGNNQRRAIARIVAGGVDGVWTGEIRRAAGYDDSTGMAGIFKAIAGRFRATGHRPLWNGGEKDSQKGQKLSVMETGALELFSKVIKANYPELAEEFGIN